MDFYRYIARSFGIKAPFETKEQFLEIFESFLLRNEESNKKVLLIIDEAQRLTSALLEEIRLLSNIEKDYTKLLNIFFVGQNEFNDIILKQKNRPLRQRITINYNIDPLEQHEVMEYINFRLGIAGCSEPLFTPDAVREVFAFSEGYPRLINIICDHALLTGFVQGVARISGPIVGECAEELRIQSVRSAEPPPPAQEAAPVIMPAPTVYPAPSPEREQDKGLTSAQTMLIVIIGILCFVAGLMVFSLRSKPSISSEAAPVRIEEKRADTVTTPPPIAVRVPVAPTEAQPAAADLSQTEPTRDVAAVEAPRAQEEDSVSTMESKPEPTPDRTSSSAGAQEVLPEPTPDPVPVVTAEQARLLERMLSGDEAMMINFMIDSNELTLEDLQDLDNIAALLNARGDIQATVTGYTDAVGNLHYNLKVSEFRANIVKTYLVGKGVNADRVKSVGMGPANPIDSNDTLEGRRRNRRVEVEFRIDDTSSLPD